MTSKATRRFWKLYQDCLNHPSASRKNYRLWRANPRHQSLDFKKLGGRPNAFPFALAIIIAHWVTRSAAALNGFGLAPMRIQQACGIILLIDFSRYCGERYWRD